MDTGLAPTGSLHSLLIYAINIILTHLLCMDRSVGLGMEKEISGDNSGDGSRLSSGNEDVSGSIVMLFGLFYSFL